MDSSLHGDDIQLGLVRVRVRLSSLGYCVTNTTTYSSLHPTTSLGEYVSNVRRCALPPFPTFTLITANKPTNTNSSHIYSNTHIYAFIMPNLFYFLFDCDLTCDIVDSSIHNFLIRLFLCFSHMYSCLHHTYFLNAYNNM